MTHDRNKQDLVFTRIFDAPVALVWRAWVDPEMVKQWWGPKSLHLSERDD
jgi:uncharacterized protein YndB with AHSA1/START domain